jgi:CBS domain-containing protein
LLSNQQALAGQYIKSHSRNVADVMTRDVVTAKLDTPLGDIAAMLERNRIKRVPIVQEGKIVGIVSRANILQALASATKKLPTLASADDSELRKKVVARLAGEPWRPTMLSVTVLDGTVDLWGLVRSVEEKKAARLAAELTPGVKAIVDNIIVQQVGSGWY